MPIPRLRVPPGVFAPRSDTRMLACELSRVSPGATVLDVCTGSGALAITAALSGARSVTAVDRSRRATLTARLNARANGVRVEALHGDLLAPVAGRRYDVIVSNPPYVPSSAQELPERGPARAWDAGLDGRAVLDRICDQARGHLLPGGTLLLTHSSLSGTGATLRRLEARGLEARVLRRARGPLGPIVSARAAELERRGLLAPGERHEELVVVAASAPGEPAASAA